MAKVNSESDWTHDMSRGQKQKMTKIVEHNFDLGIELELHATKITKLGVHCQEPSTGLEKNNMDVNTKFEMQTDEIKSLKGQTEQPPTVQKGQEKQVSKLKDNTEQVLHQKNKQTGSKYETHTEEIGKLENYFNEKLKLHTEELLELKEQNAKLLKLLKAYSVDIRKLKKPGEDFTNQFIQSSQTVTSDPKDTITAEILHW
ncbi:uncharacterized protein N7498_008159 [Penicillium cinerascens]|uniref:Uncharacterized protein n=1 Tax=Penicillium cinerascens TaxID=70096 RepID=A0A9W9JEV1_9EURO|nr:uncharacterized protein N7498_008159 [Penicillium cinerascens]KAJ5194721.1 hypothetical protein N7498_008159 [Penicillium cinerascens]